MEKVVLDGKNLTLEQVYKVVYEDAKVEIAPAAMERARKAKKVLYKMVEDETPVYGTNRGVGWNKDRKVYSEYFDQYNKIFSDRILYAFLLIVQRKKSVE